MLLQAGELLIMVLGRCCKYFIISVYRCLDVLLQAGVDYSSIC